MAEQQTQADSSPAEAVDVFNGQEPSVAEYTQYRETGELPERFKPAEQAEPVPADTQEQTEKPAEGDEPENSPEPAPDDDNQEPPQNLSKKAQRRFEKLLAQNKELQRKLEAAAKPTQTDSSPAQAPQQPPQTFGEWQKTFRPSQWMEDYAKANPESSYEDANFAMAVHISDAREHFTRIEQQVQAQRQALDSQVEEARERYEDFDEIKDDFLAKVLNEKGMPLVPVSVLSIINDSPLMPDVLYTIGSDEAELNKFVKMAQQNPNQAIRYIARVENLIEEELEQQAQEPPKSGSKAPEKQRTAAPPPPSPVGGGSSRAFDVNDESLSADEWFRKRNAELSR